VNWNVQAEVFHRDSDIIEKLSYAAEFETMSVKHNEKKQLKELNAKVLFKRPPRAGGWKDKDKKADCLAQGFLSQDINQYSGLPFALTMEARDVAEKMGRVLNGVHCLRCQLTAAASGSRYLLRACG
jgi:hypothetical protein